MANTLSMFLLLWSLIIAYIFCRAFHHLYLHPLSGVPGPKLWIAFPLYRHWKAIRGTLENELVDHHRQYGDIVRFSVDELSFTALGSMKDIYSSFPHRPALPKAFPTAKNIIQASKEDHKRYRKLLSLAFSDKSLRAQEPMIRPYVDLLVKKLDEAAAINAHQDMVRWYNLTTFDIFGELTFRESFNGLKNSNLHEWITATLQGLKLLPFMQLAIDYPVVSWLLQSTFVRQLVAASEDKDASLRRSVHQRMEACSAQYDRGDFFEALLEKRGTAEGLTEEEIHGTISSLLLAASETSATALSGMTYYMLKDPSVLSKATTEVRKAFASAEEITFESTAALLPYLQACLEEAMRLYPPVPMGIERRTPPGKLTRIGSLDVPGSTRVIFHQAAAYASPKFFNSSEDYLPERWLKPSPQSISHEDFGSLKSYEQDRREVVQPFSMGPRSCIGRSLAYCEIRLIAALVLFHFDLELCQQSEHWRTQKVFLIWQKPALWCKIKSRLR